MVLLLKQWKSRSPPGFEASAACKNPSQFRKTSHLTAGWSSPVARQAHNLKVTGSNPVPATKHTEQTPCRVSGRGLFCVPGHAETARSTRQTPPRKPSRGVRVCGLGETGPMHGLRPPLRGHAPMRPRRLGPSRVNQWANYCPGRVRTASAPSDATRKWVTSQSSSAGCRRGCTNSRKFAGRRHRVGDLRRRMRGGLAMLLGEAGALNPHPPLTCGGLPGWRSLLVPKSTCRFQIACLAEALT